MRPPTAPSPITSTAGGREKRYPPTPWPPCSPGPAALRKRGELDGNADLVRFSGCLEQAGLDIFEAGHFTEDLTMLCDPSEYTDKPDNDTLLGLIRARLEALLTA